MVAFISLYFFYSMTWAIIITGNVLKFEDDATISIKVYTDDEKQHLLNDIDNLVK